MNNFNVVYIKGATKFYFTHYLCASLFCSIRVSKSLHFLPIPLKNQLFVFLRFLCFLPVLCRIRCNFSLLIQKVSGTLSFCSQLIETIYQNKYCHNASRGLLSESTKLRALRAKIVLTCQSTSRAYVLKFQCALRGYVITCQCNLRAYVLTYQHTLRAYVLLRKTWENVQCILVSKRYPDFGLS